jgi:hypothetical protein
MRLLRSLLVVPSMRLPLLNLHGSMGKGGCYISFTSSPDLMLELNSPLKARGPDVNLQRSQFESVGRKTLNEPRTCVTGCCCCAGSKQGHGSGSYRSGHGGRCIVSRVCGGLLFYRRKPLLLHDRKGESLNWFWRLCQCREVWACCFHPCIPDRQSSMI